MAHRIFTEAYEVLYCGAQAPCYGTWAFIVVDRRLVASWNGGGLSSPTRDLTLVPCFGRWILIHWSTREVLLEFLLI